MNAALKVKAGLVELGKSLDGLAAQAGPTFGDFRRDAQGDILIITLSASVPTDTGEDMQDDNAAQLYSSKRAQEWLSTFDLEFWSEGRDGSLRNLNRYTEFDTLVRDRGTNRQGAGGTHIALLPGSIGAETNSGEKDDRWVVLSAEMRVLHLATHSGRATE